MASFLLVKCVSGFHHLDRELGGADNEGNPEALGHTKLPINLVYVSTS